MRRLLRYLPAVVVAILIAVLSLIENPQMPLLETHSDKFWHTLMYVGLAGVLMCGLLFDRRGRWFYACAAWVVSMGYGGVMELLQEWCIVSRTGDWYDWYADMLGAAIGVAGAYIFFWICKKTGYIK